MDIYEQCRNLRKVLQKITENFEEFTGGNLWKILYKVIKNFMWVFGKFRGNFWKVLWTFTNKIVEIYGKF